MTSPDKVSEPGRTAAAPPTELRSEGVAFALIAGVLVGLLQVAQSASFAALIFEGELASLLSRDIGMALFASAVGLVIITLLTSLPLSIGGTQNMPAAILGVAPTSI